MEKFNSLNWCLSTTINDSKHNNEMANIKKVIGYYFAAN